MDQRQLESRRPRAGEAPFDSERKRMSVLYPGPGGGWDNRESKTVTMQGTYDEIVELFGDNAPWSIVMKETVQKRSEDGSLVLDDAGNPVTEEQTSEWDNSEFAMSGPITDNRDGTVSIKMGKPTDLEDAMELLLGGETA